MKHIRKVIFWLHLCAGTLGGIVILIMSACGGRAPGRGRKWGVTWFRRRLPGKARDFNWHNVIGFWSAVPLFVVVISGVVISYPRASDLAYRAVGEKPPVQGRTGGATATTNDGRGLREGETLGKLGVEPRGETARRRGELRKPARSEVE